MPPRKRTTKKEDEKLAEAKKIAMEHVNKIATSISDASASVGFTLHFFTWAYLSRLGFSVLLLLVTSFLNALASAHAGYRNPNIIILNSTGQDSGIRKLPDLGHDIITYFMQALFGVSYVEWAELPDHWVKFFYPITALFVLMHPKRFAILRRLCAVYGLINALRTITVSVTSLPDPSPYCQHQFVDNATGFYKTQPRWPWVWLRAIKLVVEPATHHTCGDMIFSGHSVLLLMCCMVFQEYCTPSIFRGHGKKMYNLISTLCLIVRVVVAILTAIGLILIVGTRLHYTLDVLTATYITILLWVTYHYHMKSRVPGKKYDYAIQVLRWLEAEEVANVDDAALADWKARGVLKQVKQ